MVDGHTVADHAGMEQALHDHFAGVFGTPATPQFTLNFEALGIQALDLNELEANITDEEVWAAIKAMPSDKAPGPDGFTGAFYKAACSVIKPEVMAAVQAFVTADDRSMARLNNALIVLLPKKIGAMFFFKDPVARLYINKTEESLQPRSAAHCGRQLQGSLRALANYSQNYFQQREV